MPIEKPDYLTLLERLDQAFPGRELISKCEVAGWLGISKSTLLRRYDLPPGQKITKTSVARAVAGS